MRLKPLPLPILISLVFLVSAARSVSANSPSPTPPTHERSALRNHQAGQQVAPVGASDIPHAVNSADASTQKQENTSSTSTVIITIFTVIMGIATALIAWFNFQLVGVTDEMKRATAEAAEAAKQSAHATELALNAERPYLLVESIRAEESTPVAIPAMILGDIDPTPKVSLGMYFPIRNYGKGVGIIDSATVRLYFGHGFMSSIPASGPLIHYADEKIRIERPVIGTSDQISCGTFQLTVKPMLLEQIAKYQLSLIVIIRIRYHDVYGRSFSEPSAYEYTRLMPPPLPAIRESASLEPYIVMSLIDKDHRKYLRATRRARAKR